MTAYCSSYDSATDTHCSSERDHRGVCTFDRVEMGEDARAAIGKWSTTGGMMWRCLCDDPWRFSYAEKCDVCATIRPPPKPTPAEAKTGDIVDVIRVGIEAAAVACNDDVADSIANADVPWCRAFASAVAAHERARIVAWLRRHADPRMVAGECADDIESGDASPKAGD